MEFPCRFFMEELKTLIKEKINLEDKLREKADLLIEELIKIPHFEYLSYFVVDGMIYSSFINSSCFTDKQEYLEFLISKLKNSIVKYSKSQIFFYDYQIESDLILSLSLEKDLKTQVREIYDNIIEDLTKHAREKEKNINKAIEECKQRIEKLEKELTIVSLNKMYESNIKFI